jgi:hypothetical protein
LGDVEHWRALRAGAVLLMVGVLGDEWFPSTLWVPSTPFLYRGFTSRGLHARERSARQYSDRTGR